MEPAGRRRRVGEFAMLYVVVPVVVAIAIPPGWMFPALFLFTAVGLGLLARTPGFAWGELIAGWRWIDWRLVSVVALAAALAGVALLAATRPQALFLLPCERPGLMVAIAVLYPLLSALPQEIVFRALFFRRYGDLLPRGAAALALNAALFALAHLMYWSAVVLVFSFAGGLLFAWAFRVRRNFPEAVALHAAAGVALFAVGMGVYFYSGNVVRPF